jgi:hypothetical protein
MSPHLQAFNVVLLASGGSSVCFDGGQNGEEVGEGHPLFEDFGITQSPSHTVTQSLSHTVTQKLLIFGLIQSNKTHFVLFDT